MAFHYHFTAKMSLNLRGIVVVKPEREFLTKKQSKL
jgi:hypothetical protein